MKKIFTVFMLVTMIFTVGCDNKEQDAAKDTQPKVEQTTNVSIDEIDHFGSVCADSLITLGIRLEDIRKSGKHGDMSKTEIDKFVNNSSHELDSLSKRIVNRIQELKEKAKSGSVSKSEMDKFVAEIHDKFDSLSMDISKIEMEIGLR